MISKFSVKKPYTVLVGVILAVVLGIVSFTKMTTDLMPDISLPYIIVMTTYPGASPETVEMVVTQPVESGMATISNIESISSVSNENYSMVLLEFAQSTDMNAVSLEIRECLDQIESFWNESVGNPIIIKMNPDMMPVMIAAVGVEGMDHAEISQYVQDTITPEIKSVEGIASVSSVGMLEKSVNVILRQDKIDAVNEKIFAAIDEKMEDAESEIAEGKNTISQNKKEIQDGQKEIAEGKSELLEGEKKLEDGKKELENQKNATAVQLANTKKELLTAKTDLEASKMSLTTNLATANSLHASINEVNLILNAATTYQNALQLMLGSVSNGDAASAEEGRKQIENLKDSYMKNSILTKMGAESPEIQEMLNGLNAMDWTDYNQSMQVAGILGMISKGAEAQLQVQKENMQSALNSITNGMGYDAYVKFADSTLKTLEQKLGAVNAGLVEVEKGQLSAAIKFSEANSKIALSEYEMNLAKTQLEQSGDQLKDALEQLKEAEDKLSDSKTQLSDSKEEAYKQADLNKILTVDTVKNLLTAQNFSMPAGYVMEDGISYLVRVGDQPETVDEFKKMPLLDLHMDGVDVITLEDVAEVFYTDNSDEIYTNVNGNPGVMLSIQKQTGYSTGEVSDLLTERFAELTEENKDLSMVTLMDQGIYIDLVMDSILNNVFLGAILAILILILFLKDLRPTIVVAFSIPISLVTSIVCMYFTGVTLNVISLSGLSLGIGMLVDNSIVVIENIYRLRGEGYSMREAAIQGAKEVAAAIMASTLTTICVFLPIVFTEGITRQLFVDMGLTIAYSMLASLAIALTVVPAMSSKMLTKAKEQKQGKFYYVLIRVYRKVLAFSLRVKVLVYLMVLLLLVGSVVAAATNGTAFMTEMDSTQLEVRVTLPEGATLQETGAISDRVVSCIMEIEDVEDVGAMTNTSNMEMISGSGSDTLNATTIYVVLSDDKTMSNEEIGALILQKTAGLDAEIVVNTSNMDMSAMGGSGISIQIRGRDIDTLQEIANEVAAIAESVEGTEQVQDGMVDTDEEIRIIIDREKAVKYGLTVAQVFGEISKRLENAKSATTLVASEQDYNVYVMNGADQELNKQILEAIEIEGKDEEGINVSVKLSDIASFESARAMRSISRIEQTRYVTVTAKIADGYNIGLVSQDLEKKLENFDLPNGYRIVFSGENEMINDAIGQVMLMLLLALIFMYLIMVAQFQSLLSPFIIMFTIPLAFTGGFMGLYLTGSEISVIAMIGFVMLSGIIVNNGIVLVDYMNQLREGGMERREAILNAGETRLRPVLMTALTTILALSTMVFSHDMGSEMSKPMAIVTIGGLLYGTLLTLIVVPCIYDSFTSLQEKIHKRPTKENQ